MDGVTVGPGREVWLLSVGGGIGKGSPGRRERWDSGCMEQRERDCRPKAWAVGSPGPRAVGGLPQELAWGQQTI